MCFAILERVKKETNGNDYDHLSDSLFKVVDLLIVGVLLPMTEISAAREVLKSCEVALPEYARTAIFDAITNAEDKQHGSRVGKQKQGESLINGNSDNLSPDGGSNRTLLERYNPRDMFRNSMVFVYGGLHEKEWLTWERAGQMVLGAGTAVVVASVAYRSRRSIMRWSKTAVVSFRNLLLGD